jgi:hypothetical protein
MRTSYAVSMVLLALIVMPSMGLGQVMVNEAYSRGVTGNLDWVEVYNNSDAAIDISGYKIYDDGGQTGSKDKKPFPAGTVLAAHGYFVIITDTASAGLNDKFGLSSSGDKVWLDDASGSLIDSAVIPTMGLDTSWARQTDGAASWMLLSPMTRGTSNSQVLLNEAYSRGSTGNLDWVEVHNVTHGAIDISGFKIYDGGGLRGEKPKKLFPSGTIIPASGFAVIVTDTNVSAADSSKFGLSTTADTVWLERPTGGVMIDMVAIPALGKDTSWARQPDGSPTWVRLTPVTKGATNGGTVDVEEHQILPSSFALMQNYPNPFNPATTIRYSVGAVSGQRSAVSSVELVVYDLLGRRVALLVNEAQQPGEYSVRFDASNLTSGVYFYTITAGNFTATKKLMLLK